MTHSGFLSRAEHQKRYYHRQKAKGLCPECSNKPLEGRTFCKKHFERHKIKSRGAR